MPIYDYECPACGLKGEFITDMSENQRCPGCGAWMKRLLSPPFINMGVGAYGYYDENLGCHVGTNREKRRLMREQGVTPKGDTPKPHGEAWV